MTRTNATGITITAEAQRFLQHRRTRRRVLRLPVQVAQRPMRMVASMVLSDLAMLGLAGLGAILFWSLFATGPGVAAYLRLWPVLGIFLVGYAAARLYPALPLSPADELRRLTGVTSLACLALGTGIFLSKEADNFSRMAMMLTWLLALVLVPAGRAALRLTLSGRSWWGYPVVIVGAGESARQLIRTLRRQREIGFKPVAVLDDRARGRVAGVPIVGRLDQGPTLARQYGLTYAILAQPDLPSYCLGDLMRRFSRSFKHVMVMPELVGFSSLWVAAKDMGGVLGLEVRHRLLDRDKRLLKAGLEVALVLVLLPLLMPLIGLISLAIRLESKGPVFYGQQRIGQGGKRFTICKFRTMVQNADEVLAKTLEQDEDLSREWESTHKLKHDPRVTRVGRFLRKTSLDELPQLFNVLRGQMSLVGPRPIIDAELPRYAEDFELYQQVRPGVTGIWQISGRNDLPYEQRVRMDAYYVRNWSVWLDLHLLCRTVLAVLTGRGAY